MKLEIKYNNIESSESLSQHIERRVHFALSRFGDKIFSVVIKLKDLNGPRGGLDKKCQLLIRLRSRLIILEGAEDNFYTAVDLILERAQRQVAREVGRLNGLRLKQAILFSQRRKRKPELVV